MHRFKLISVAAALALVFAGSALAYRVVRIGQPQNGKTVLLYRSDRLVVTLIGNATAGYSWSVLHLDPSVVKFVSRTYVAPAVPPKVGASGKYVLRFRAVGTGTTKLKLGYQQQGNSNARPTKTYSVKLIVKTAQRV